MIDFNDPLLQRMRDKEIKDFSCKELYRVFKDSLAPTIGIYEVQKMIKEGLTIDQVWKRLRTLRWFVEEICNAEQQIESLNRQVSNLTFKAKAAYGKLAYSQARVQYNLDMLEAEKFLKDPAWNDMGRGDMK